MESVLYGTGVWPRLPPLPFLSRGLISPSPVSGKEELTNLADKRERRSRVRRDLGAGLALRYEKRHRSAELEVSLESTHQTSCHLVRRTHAIDAGQDPLAVIEGDDGSSFSVVLG